ncbi:MAG: hypothetical protein Q8N37_02780 [bacterium]|nr:hypothetical protein [bacterium]
MSIYHKIVELSIATVSLAGLALGLFFPQVALASNIGKNNVFNFSFSEKAEVLPLVLGKNNLSFVNIADLDSKNKENYKTVAVPVKPAIEKSNKVNKVIVLTLTKKVAEEEFTAISEEGKNNLAKKICEAAGIYALPCWQDLKAMREKESFDGKAMTGDGGKSRGWYHIQTKLHKVSDACAMDFECSTEWTVKNLITNGYKIDRLYAISRHNGGGKMAQIYARNVVYNSAKFER